jgi:hypothetical protein
MIEVPKARLAAVELVAGVAVVNEAKGEVTLSARARKLILKLEGLVAFGGVGRNAAGSCRGVSDG